MKLKPIIHHNTKNKSFIDVCRKLKQNNVKKYYFPLILYDEDLLHIDPSSEDLTNLETSKILNEVIRNPYYYFREICRVPVPGGLTNFRLSIGNLAIIYTLINNLNLYIVLPRQQGKTMGILSVIHYFYRFTSEYTTALLFHKVYTDAKENLLRIKNLDEGMYEYLKIWDGKDDKINTEEMFLSRRTNKIKAMPTAISEESADMLGRGHTAAIEYFDEFGFLRFNQVIYEAATFAQRTAAKYAKENNSPYSKIISTTPNNLDLDNGAYARQMLEDSAPMHFAIYDMDIEEVREYISNYRINFLYVEYSYKELGHDDIWFKEQCIDCNWNMLKIKREVLLEWTKSSDTSIFTEEAIDRLYKNDMKEVIGMKKILDMGYVVNFLEVYRKDNVYGIGVDVAGGLSNENSAFVVECIKTKKCIAYFKSKTIELSVFNKLLVHVLTVIFPNSVVSVERSSISFQLIENLVKIPQIKSRMVYHTSKDDTTVEDMGKKKFSFTSRTKANLGKKKYGILTNSASRPVMIDELTKEVINNPERFNFKELIKEVANLEDRGGKVQHSTSTHDDLVFAWLMNDYASKFNVSYKHIVRRLTQNTIIENRKIDTKQPIDILLSSTSTNKKSEQVRNVPQHNSSYKQLDMNSIFKLNR